MRILIVGCGYVGSEVARSLPASCVKYALTRSADRSQELADLGVEPIVGDWTNSAALPELPSVDWVLVAVPHREVGDLASQTHVTGLKHLFAKIPPGWQRLVYLSSTGIYGDCKDVEVNEDTPPAPNRIGPEIAVTTEAFLKEEYQVKQVTILRLAGIYGPGRLPLAAKLRAGEPLAVPQSGYLNLIHVQDIANMIGTVFQRQMDRMDYVFSDGNPVLRAEFYEYLAQACGVQNPVFVEPSADDKRARRATSKRINPEKLVTETSFQYAFSDYRAGIQDSLKSTV